MDIGTERFRQVREDKMDLVAGHLGGAYIQS